MSVGDWGSLAQKLALVRTVNVSVGDWGSATGKEDLFGTSLLGHEHDFATGSTSDDTVVNKKHVLVLELDRDGIELSTDTLLTSLLVWHDEGTENVAVLDEALAVRDLQVFGHSISSNLLPNSSQASTPLFPFPRPV